MKRILAPPHCGHLKPEGATVAFYSASDKEHHLLVNPLIFLPPTTFIMNESKDGFAYPAQTLSLYQCQYHRLVAQVSPLTP